MIKVIKDRVAIVPLENPEQIGHIIIPDVAKSRLNQGFVKYCGPDCKNVTVGDYVLFSGYTGTTTSIENEGKLIIMPEEFIIAHISRLPNIQIPGLYFRVKELITVKRSDGVIDDMYAYESADYETIMGLVAQAFAENPQWRDRFNVLSTEKPTLKDYEKV